MFNITRGGFPHLCVQRERFGTGVCVVLTSLRITDKHFNLKLNFVCFPVNSCSLVVVVGRGGGGSKHLINSHLRHTTQHTFHNVGVNLELVI